MVHGAFAFQALLWPQHLVGACGWDWRTTKPLGVLFKTEFAQWASMLLSGVHAFVKHISSKKDQEERKDPFKFFNR